MTDIKEEASTDKVMKFLSGKEAGQRFELFEVFKIMGITPEEASQEWERIMKYERLGYVKLRYSGNLTIELTELGQKNMLGEDEILERKIKREERNVESLKQLCLGREMELEAMRQRLKEMRKQYTVHE